MSEQYRPDGRCFCLTRHQKPGIIRIRRSKHGPVGSPGVPFMEPEALEERRYNPKRMQRQIEKQLRTTGIGTKAQQALKLQQEQRKTAGKRASRQEREAEQVRRFALRQEKRIGH